MTNPEDVDYYIEIITGTRDFENLPDSTKVDLLITLSDMRAIQFAHSEGLEPDRVGVSMLEVFNQPVKFIKANPKVNKTPIFGYFALNYNEIGKLKSVEAFEKELAKEIKKAKRLLNQQASIVEDEKQ